jgi:hypothetical protein
MHYYTLEISAYEVALENDFPTRHENAPFDYLHLLSSCLTATKAFLDILSSILPKHYLTLPYPVYAAYYHALGTLSNLSFLLAKAGI